MLWRGPSGVRSPFLFSVRVGVMLKKVLLLLALLFAGSQASAATGWDAVLPNGGHTTSFSPGSATFSNGTGTAADSTFGNLISRAVSTPAGGATSADAAVVDETFSALLNGNVVSLTAERTLGMAAIGDSMAGIGTVAAGALGASAALVSAGAVGFTAGAAISHFLGNDTLTVGATRCTASYGGWMCDAGTAPTAGTSGSYVTNGNLPSSASDPQSSCSAFGSGAATTYFNAIFAGQNETGTLVSSTYDPSGSLGFGAGMCVVKFSYSLTNGGGGGTQQGAWPVVQSGTGTGNTCPASIDALNPLWSQPSGGSPDADGMCKTGRYTQPTPTQLSQRIAQYGIQGLAAPAVQAWLNAGGQVQGAVPSSISGPTSAPAGQPTTSTTVNPGGTTTTTTSTPTANYTYSPTTVNYSTTTTTVTNNGGNITTTTTNAPGTAATDPTLPCGLPNTAKCKIDETGTPAYVPPDTSVIDGLQSTDGAKRDAAAASVQDPGFGWFSAPPIASCTPFDFPVPGGSTQSIDPCGPMETVRGIMGYVWALFGTWWSFGIIRKAVTGG